MPIGTGPAAAAMAILTAIRARNQSALEEARARREDQDFALRQAAQQAAQRNAAMQTEMQRTNNLINLSREQRAVQKENESSINAARSQFLSDMDPYTKSRERGVPEAVAPMAAEARKWVDYAPEYAKPGNPMHDTLDAQLKSDMEPMAAKAAEVAKANREEEFKIKTTPKPVAPKPPPPPRIIPDSAAKEVAGYESNIQSTEKLIGMLESAAKAGGGTDIYKMKMNEVAKLLPGMRDVDQSLIRAQGGMVLSDFMRTQSGLVVNENEARRLANVVFSESDDLATGLAKLRNHLAEAGNKKRTRARVLKEAGYNVPQDWTNRDYFGSTPGAAPATNPNDEALLRKYGGK